MQRRSPENRYGNSLDTDGHDTGKPSTAAKVRRQMLKDVPYNFNSADIKSWRQQLVAIYEDPDMTDQFYHNGDRDQIALEVDGSRHQDDSTMRVRLRFNRYNFSFSISIILTLYTYFPWYFLEFTSFSYIMRL